MTGSHEPTPEFRAFMESEVVRALRRETRIGARARTVRRARLRTAAIVFLAFAVGVAAGAAPARVQATQQRSELLEAVQADLRIAAMRLDLARSELESARRKFDAGLIRRESFAEAEAAVREMETRVAKIQLNEQEIRVTGAPPRDEITAPLVKDADFVSQRLRLDLGLAQQKLRAAEQADAEQERLEKIGAITRTARLEAQTGLERARGELGILAARIQTRKEFLEDHLPAADAEERLQRQELQFQADLAHHLYNLAQERFQRLQLMRMTDLASELDVKRAEVEMLERKTELERIERQLQALKVRAIVKSGGGG